MLPECELNLSRSGSVAENEAGRSTAARTARPSVGA
jgi:hypothetical protein